MNKLNKIVFIFSLLIFFTGCNLFNDDILKKIEINANCKIINNIDNHGGFLGDGDYFAKIKCSEIKYDELSKNWKKLPLSSELNQVMEMIQCDNIGCQNIYEKYSIPKIVKGYYYFLDRHFDSKNKYDDSNINNRASYNFTVALLDKNNNTIYYYELDT